ncbi:hypothetical protein VNI00_013838 [Paramarasmius palmivorus]|uniref:Uncharacterized protein n=1 Tax=Paramarasmius palmivorus TaxID=297713 RepID=A0AAW0BWL6_9AGAR
MQKAPLSLINHDSVAKGVPAFTTTKQGQPANIAVEIWDEIFYHVNADAKDPFHLAMHATHRLINRTIGAVAERKFFEELFLPVEYRRRMIQCMRLMVAKPDLANLVRDIYIELSFDLNLFSVITDVTSGLGNMNNLRILQMRVTISWDCRGALHSILSQLQFPSLQEFAYHGGIVPEIQVFVTKHAPTIRLLTLDGDEMGEFIGPEPQYPVLLHSSVPRHTLAQILRGGAPSLQSFHTPFESTSEDVIVMARQLQQTRGTAMIELALVAHDDGRQLFSIVEESFPNLRSLTILLTGYLVAALDESELSNQAVGKAALSCFRKLTQLNKLFWGNMDGYHGDWDRGWNFLGPLQEANPGLISVTLPDSGVWHAVGPGIWIPFCGGGGPFLCNQGCHWLTFSVYYGNYSPLPALLDLVEQEILRRLEDASPGRKEDMELVQNFRRNPNDQPLDEVSGASEAAIDPTDEGNEEGDEDEDDEEGVRSDRWRAVCCLKEEREDAGPTWLCHGRDGRPALCRISHDSKASDA